jgi:flavin reductase (DIM6/NTAB) family NADH-FMN oxidoreductase RutF
MLTFDPTDYEPVAAQGILSSVVGPRPIAMVSTANDDGTANVAPFSYFMAVTGRPMLVAITMGLRSSDAGDKDTYRNAMRTCELVVNVTTDAMRDDIEVAAMELPSHESELELLPWTAVASQRVSAPSVAESPVHLECRVHRVVDLGEPGVQGSHVHVVFAEVVLVVVDDSVCVDGRVDPALLAPIGRLAFPWFTRTTPESMFQLTRVPYEQFRATGERPGPVTGVAGDPTAHVDDGAWPVPDPDRLPPAVRREAVTQQRALAGDLEALRSLPAGALAPVEPDDVARFIGSGRNRPEASG